MSQACTVKAQLQLTGEYQDLNAIRTVRDPIAVNFYKEMTNGAGADQVSKCYQARVSLAAAPTELDLAAVLTDAFGNVLSFTAIKVLYIKNNSAVADEPLLVGGAAANGWITMFGDATDKLKIGPSAAFVAVHSGAGYAVTAGTGDLLKLDPGAKTFTVDIVIIGV